MELEFSYRALKKIVENYYLKNEKLRVKFNYELKEMYHGGFSTNYFISYKENINGVKYSGSHELSDDEMVDIFEDYLEPKGYDVRYLEPIISDETLFYINDYHLAGMKLICNKKKNVSKTLKKVTNNTLS